MFYDGVDIGYLKLYDAIFHGEDETDKKSIRYCTHCPAKECSGACPRIMALENGDPDFMKRSIGVTRGKFGFDVRAFAEEVGVKRDRIYALLKKGKTVDEIKEYYRMKKERVVCQ